MSNVKLQGKIDEKQLKEILQAISGINYFQWNLIKGAVDRYLSSKVAKVEIDDLDELESYGTKHLKL